MKRIALSIWQQCQFLLEILCSRLHAAAKGWSQSTKHPFEPVAKEEQHQELRLVSKYLADLNLHETALGHTYVWISELCGLTPLCSWIHVFESFIHSCSNKAILAKSLCTSATSVWLLHSKSTGIHCNEVTRVLATDTIDLRCCQLWDLG